MFCVESRVFLLALSVCLECHSVDAHETDVLMKGLFEEEVVEMNSSSRLLEERTKTMFCLEHSHSGARSFLLISSLGLFLACFFLCVPMTASHPFSFHKAFLSQ